MSQSFDLSRFPNLPPEVVQAFAAQQAALEAAQFEVVVERAARQHEQAVVAEKEAFITELKALIERLEGQVQDYRRTKFGPKSEKLDPAQLELALEDLETAVAETQARIAAVEDTPKRTGGDPLRLAFCWAHGRRKLIKAKPKKGSPIVDEALLRIAAVYKVEDSIRGANPDGRRAVRQDLSRPLVDAFFAWLEAQAARVSRKSDLGVAMSYMLKRQDGFRLFLDDGCVDIDSNLVENAIRSPAMNRRNALFAGHDEGGRSWANYASLIGTCKMNGVEPYAYLRDLFTRLAHGHLAKDIDVLMPWAYAKQTIASQ